MTNKEAVNWIINLSADIGKSEHSELWHYEQALYEIREILESAQPEPSTEIQEILDYLDTTLHPIVSPDNWNVYAELHDMVSELPSAQPEPRWIPVTERLPDEDGRYLVFRQNNGKIFIDSWMVGRGWLFFETVTAWMPLPELYKGGE